MAIERLEADRKRFSGIVAAAVAWGRARREYENALDADAGEPGAIGYDVWYRKKAEAALALLEIEVQKATTSERGAHAE